MTTATVPAEIAHLDFDAPDPCEFDTATGHCTEAADYRVTIAFDQLDVQLVQNYCERHCTGLVSHLALCEACGSMYRVVEVERV